MTHKHILTTLLAATAMTLAANAQTTKGGTEGGAGLATPQQQYSIDGRHRGLDFNIHAGYHIGVGDSKGSGSIPVEVGVGKQFHPNIYVGLSSGAWIGTGDASDPIIPLAADFKIMFPSKTQVPTTMKPFISFRLGYGFNTASGGTLEVPGYSETIEIPDPDDVFFLEIMPGLQFPISQKTDFLLSAGYTHQFVDGASGGAFTVKAGLNFHRAANWKKRPPRPKVPTRDRGLQLTLEAVGTYGTDFSGGMNLALTYKLNPHFAVGGGVGFAGLKVLGDTEVGDLQVIESNVDYEGNYTVTEYNGRYSRDPMFPFSMFARGEYRMLERRCSPIVTLDVGAQMRMGIGDLYYDSSMSGYDAFGDPRTTTFFAAPAVGYSFRTTNNSYLNLKVGYSLTPNLKALKGVKEYDNTTCYYASRSKKMSHLFFSFGFTHTFGKK